MKKLSIAMMLILASAATLMLAQAPPPDPAGHAQHHVKRLTTLLSLTAAQQQQATSIFTNAANSESSMREQFKSARQSLSAAVKSNNTGAIDQIAATMGNLNAQSTAIHAKAQAAFYQILTPEQQEKLNELESEGPEGFGPGGHGGPDGPGPFPH